MYICVENSVQNNRRKQTISLQIFKDCLPQFLLDPLLNTFSHVKYLLLKDLIRTNKCDINIVFNLYVYYDTDRDHFSAQLMDEIVWVRSNINRANKTSTLLKDDESLEKPCFFRLTTFYLFPSMKCLFIFNIKNTNRVFIDDGRKKVPLLFNLISYLPFSLRSLIYCK